MLNNIQNYKHILKANKMENHSQKNQSAFDQIQRGILHANFPESIDFEKIELKDQLEKGLIEMRSGLEKIRLCEKLFKDDQWIFDWFSILSNRIDVFEQSMDLEESF